MDLLTAAKAFPDMTVSIRLRDLLEAQETLIRKVRTETEREAEKRRQQYGDTLIQKEEARQILGGPDPSTMWRWEQRGYLTPVRIGVKVFYRRSDLDRIIKSKEQQTI